MAALSQIVTVAYPEVLADARKAHNQWAESSFLKFLERKGAVEMRAGGQQLEFPLDIAKNAGTDVLATDTTATSTTATDVLAGAFYAQKPLVVPINITIADEARTSGDGNKKIEFAKSLIRNGIDSHDDEMEVCLFGTSTDGVLGLANLVPTSGQPNVGGIDGASATYWRNHADTYQPDGSDILAALTIAYNTAAKGTGSKLNPSIIISDGPTQSLYEAQLQPQQRWESTQDGKAGFKTLWFKNAEYAFSHRGNTKIYLLNPTSFKVVAIKGYFRRLESDLRFTAAAVRNQMIVSMIQNCVNNPSRLAVLSPA